MEEKMTRLKRATIFTMSLIILSLLLFACSKKEKLTAIVVGPVITAATSGNLTATGATITWTTDVTSTSQVFYGLDTNFSSSTTIADTVSGKKSHSVVLSGLTASTKYYYYVSSKDVNGNTNKTGDDGSLSFTTSAGGTITDAAVSSVTDTGATVSWTTSVAATGQVNSGTTSALGTASAKNTNLSTSHAVVLSSLTAGTTYYYQAVSEPATGAALTSAIQSFSTNIAAAAPASTMYLLIDDVKIEGTGGTMRQIYLNSLDPSANIITGSNAGNNVGYMAATTPSDWKTVFPADPDFAYATDHSPATGSTECWRNSLNYKAQSWAGMIILASGYFRTDWPGKTPTPTAADLSGPTGTVKLKCYMKVTGVTSAKVKFGIGETSGESIVSQKTATVTVTNSWQQFQSVDLSGLSLTSVNAIFLWVIGPSTDVTP